MYTDKLKQLELLMEERKDYGLRLEELENHPNVDRVLFKDDKRYLEQKALFEILLRKMLSDKKVTFGD